MVGILEQMKLLAIQIRILIHSLANSIKYNHKKYKPIKVRIHDNLKAYLNQDILIVTLTLINNILFRRK